MKYYILGAMFMLILAGCIGGTPEVPTDGDTDTDDDVIECHIVLTEEPYTEEVCEEVTYMEEECEMRELTYTSSQIMITDLCADDGDCVGKDVFECLYTCTGAMKRCQINITNTDEYEGTWVVGATFGYNGAAFIKNPESKKILPGETYTFDFQQLYTLGDPPSTATCTVTVLYPAIKNVCINVEKTRIDCTNVTKMRVVETEVCN